MSLRLRYLAQTTIPVEVEGIVPHLLRGQSAGDVEKLPIWHGNRRLPLAEMFAVAGDPADGCLEFEGELAGVHWIGAGMTEGVVRVQGNAGRHVGSEMTGGEVHVAGDASDWVGGEMHGGLIHVRGRAGHLIGAAYRGSARGMTGGAILVGGDVGNEVGHSMRRGFLAIGGAAGDFAALNMIAGTVLVFGDCGIRPAAGMRRGTLGLFGDVVPPLLGTFRRGGSCQPTFLNLYYRFLAQRGFAVPEKLSGATYRMHHGDMVAAGRGEVFTLA